MKQRSLALLFCSLNACVTYHPAMIKTGDDYRISLDRAHAPQEPWGITPLPNGELLSDDWVVNKGGGKDQHHFGFLYKQVREDGSLSFACDPLPDGDAKKSLPTLAERFVTAVRTSSASGAFGTEKPLESVAIDGADAQEATYSLRRAEDTAPLRRFYFAVMRPFAMRAWCVVSFASAPGQYETSIEEVRNFVHRFHFDSDGVPKSPGVGAPPPAKKPETPDPKPATPHHTPAGVALPG
jgi:hypothetical protein